jgi:hypothetical protein
MTDFMEPRYYVATVARNRYFSISTPTMLPYSVHEPS